MIDGGPKLPYIHCCIVIALRCGFIRFILNLYLFPNFLRLFSFISHFSVFSWFCFVWLVDFLGVMLVVFVYVPRFGGGLYVR